MEQKGGGETKGKSTSPSLASPTCYFCDLEPVTKRPCNISSLMHPTYARLGEGEPGDVATRKLLTSRPASSPPD